MKKVNLKAATLQAGVSAAIEATQAPPSRALRLGNNLFSTPTAPYRLV
jgi:hypothetical protein